ncbi:Phosphopantetheine adenylyltransferase [Abditibacterium utsteinense]|uniref:Phosphopantetheine adenylyltransferase n=1 Tax=Abditibacterium utsteinense TaxID=1960156 RepID=A0A2S8SXK7_9BACT|nr:pantetheine-phosphate adenylyltransferase [Abditibacterium utsteinense]PQV65498.1 Phosphopantetheine adenylyltransferase [Abditibacterium utsteinense]
MQTQHIASVPGATAIYPGTFDPVTQGHLDILREAARIFGRVVAGVGINPRKVALFSVEERLEMLRAAVAENELENVEVASFAGLTVDFAKSHNAPFIVRGLRAVTDFENEMSLVLANEQLDPSIKTLFLMPSHSHLYLSSSIVRQAAEIGRRVIPGSVPGAVEAKLREKFGF